MRFYLAGLVLISIFAVSILGFIGLSSLHNHDMGGNCVANVAAGVTCPIKDGIFAFAIFHIKSLGGLSQSAFFGVSPVFVLFFVIFAAFALSLFKVPGLGLLRRCRGTAQEDKTCDPGLKRVSWIARLEHSPSLMISA